MFSIRKANTTDIELLTNLAREIWTEYYTEIISMEQIEYMLNMMYSHKTIENEILAGVYWNILEENNKPVGFVVFTNEGNKNLKLNKLYVQVTHHGKGFGQKAINYVVNFAEQNEFTNVYLVVNKKNLRAIKTYERYGFVCTEQVIKDIGKGYVMDDFVYTYVIVG